MQINRYDEDNAITVITAVIVKDPVWGPSVVYGHQAPLVEAGTADLNEPAFATGPLVVTDGVIAGHTNDAGEIDLTPLAPYINRFFARDWHTEAEESGHMNDWQIDAGAEGGFLWDAFTHEGTRYNIVCYLGLQTTVMLASEY
jgi:hypothetical protein